MNLLVILLLILVTLWMCLCAFCGYKLLFLRFVAVSAAGLAANAIWMIFGLDARLTEPHFLLAMASAGVYALCAFGMGVIAGRLVRRWRASAVDTRGV